MRDMIERKVQNPLVFAGGNHVDKRAMYVSIGLVSFLGSGKIRLEGLQTESTLFSVVSVKKTTFEKVMLWCPRAMHPTVAPAIMIKQKSALLPKYARS